MIAWLASGHSRVVLTGDLDYWKYGLVSAQYQRQYNETNPMVILGSTVSTCK